MEENVVSKLQSSSDEMFKIFFLRFNPNRHLTMMSFYLFV